MENVNRRSFIRKSAIAIAGAGLYSSMPISYATGAPSDRVNIGVIGVGRGTTNIRSMLQANSFVHCTAMCDVDQERLETQSNFIKKGFPEQTGNMKLYTDFRKLLENKDIDGVIIATPDFWHTYMYAEATKAGKAVYVEKPTGLTVGDCNLMVDLQRKYKNVVTTGLWHINVDYFTEAFNILKSGVLGDVYKVHAWITYGTDPDTWSTEPQTVPATLDYNMWLGPTPQRPYNNERVHGWNRYWDYGGGQQTNWIHYLDSALDGIAALGHKRTYPKSVYSIGYKHPKTMSEVPSIQTSIFIFDDLHLEWQCAPYRMYNRRDGAAWIGSKGTLVCNRTGYELIPYTGPEGKLKPLIEPVKKEGRYANELIHGVKWAESIRDNNQDGTIIDKGCYATLLANIANISYRLGGKSLEYLPDERKFRNNPEADSYIIPEYHNNWKYPQV